MAKNSWIVPALLIGFGIYMMSRKPTSPTAPGGSTGTPALKQIPPTQTATQQLITWASTNPALVQQIVQLSANGISALWNEVFGGDNTPSPNDFAGGLDTGGSALGPASGGGADTGGGTGIYDPLNDSYDTMYV